MIFLVAANEPTLFVMLSEQDVASMRQGRTTFVDKRALGKYTFDRVVLSLSKTDNDSIALLNKAGHKVDVEKAAVHSTDPGESVCKGCAGLIKTESMFEDKCIVCWAAEAKNKRTSSN
jgi:hypothetical protein